MCFLAVSYTHLQATKIIMPSEIQGMAGLAKSVVETIKDK